MKTINIDSATLEIYSDNNGGFSRSQTGTVSDFSGLIKLANPSNVDSVTVVVALTDNPEDICPPATQSATIVLDPGASYYLPTSAINKTTYQLTLTSTNTSAPIGGVGATVDVQGYVGSPKVTTATANQVVAWDKCRHNGTIRLRGSGNSVALTASFDQGSPPQNLNIREDFRTHELAVPSGATTLTLATTANPSVSSNIELIDQATTNWSITWDGTNSDFVVPTRAIVLDSGSSSSTLTVSNQSGHDIEVVTQTFDGAAVPTVTIGAEGSGSVPVYANTAWLNIGSPTQIEASKKQADDPDPDSPTTGGTLFDDPVVVVKHTGCGGGD